MVKSLIQKLKQLKQLTQIQNQLDGKCPDCTDATCEYPKCRPQAAVTIAPCNCEFCQRLLRKGDK